MTDWYLMSASSARTGYVADREQLTAIARASGLTLFP
jgi:hypothetical protein